MNNQFESFGEYIRNLLSPYSMIIQILEGINKKDTSRKEKNLLMQFLLDEDKIASYKDNLEHFIEFSKIDENEKMNWRATKLFEEYSKENNN